MTKEFIMVTLKGGKQVIIRICDIQRVSGQDNAVIETEKYLYTTTHNVSEVYKRLIS